MDIGNLLNDKPKQPLYETRATSVAPTPSLSQMNSVHLAPASTQKSHTGSSPLSSFDSKYPLTSEYNLASFSPHAMQRPTGFSPQSGVYSESVSYAPNITGSDSGLANQQLPYDPTIEDRTRVAVTADAIQQGVSTPSMPSQRLNGEGSVDGEDALPKAFACTTCHKGFARRSDLVRHERIHSGVRPHACQHPACGKQFIQRSALTVHERVHTKEKPHLCEKCGKPFSDSSSLARHRRIHSGTRPYQCPYADCQKTFTRRTTLTRHQNHHTGTVEEAAAARAASLAGQANAQVLDQTHGQTETLGDQEDQSQSDASSSVASYNPYAPPMNTSFSRPAAFQAQPSPSDYYPGAPGKQPFSTPRPVAPSRSQSDIKVEQYPHTPGSANVSNPWPQSTSEVTGQHSQTPWESGSAGRASSTGENYGYQAPYQPGYR